MTESIFSKLKHEHLQVKNLLNEIEHSKESSVTMPLFKKIKKILVPHMEGEERTLYSKLKDDSDDELAEELALEANYEHHELKEYLQRLTLLDVSSNEWWKEFYSFKEHFLQHVLEEETEIFDEAKEDFSPKELEQLSQKFEEAKHHPL